MSIQYRNGLVKSKYCGHWSFLNRETGEIIRYVCKSARCVKVECRKAFARERARLISTLVEEHELWKFFTLTFPQDIPKELCWEVMPEVWAIFHKKVRKRYSGFKFVMVPEEHPKSGYPHLHGFTNLYIPQEEWTRLWSDAGGGVITWVERVKTGNVANYVAKQIARYVGKQQVAGAVRHLPKRARSLFRSRIKASFETKKDNDVDNGWDLHKEIIFDESERMLYNVVKVEDHFEFQYKGEYQLEKERRQADEQEKLLEARRTVSKESPQGRGQNISKGAAAAQGCFNFDAEETGRAEQEDQDGAIPW